VFSLRFLRTHLHKLMRVPLAGLFNTVIDDRGRLTSMPRRLLDPRRPAGPMSKNDKEEMLIPYEAVLPTDPRRVISHEAEVSSGVVVHRSACDIC
jgi:hypothetical protein